MNKPQRRRERKPRRRNAPTIKLPAPRVCERYDIVDRTLDRWLKNKALKFPKPLYINKRRYFDLVELEYWERAQAVQAIALQHDVPAETIRRALMRDSHGRAAGSLGVALDMPDGEPGASPDVGSNKPKGWRAG
jgi:hypothetical protein